MTGTRILTNAHPRRKQNYRKFRRLATLAQRLVQADPGGDRHVQAGYGARHRQPHELVATRRNALAETGLFAAHHEGQVAVQGRVVETRVMRIGTSDRVSQSLYEVTLDGHLALVMGREETGLGKAVAARCDQLVSLPMVGRVSSLNVSVATGICLYETLRQRR